MPAPHPWMPVHFSYIGGSPSFQKELREVKTSKQEEMRGDEKWTPDFSWAHPVGKKEEEEKKKDNFDLRKWYSIQESQPELNSHFPFDG